MTTPQEIANLYVESLEDATGTQPATFITPLDQIELDIDPKAVKEEGFWMTKQTENLVVWYDDVVETSLENDVRAWLEVRDDIECDTEEVIAEVFNLYGRGQIAPDTELEDMLSNL